MQSSDFRRRMAHVLASRVEAVKAREQKPRRMLGVLSAFAATLVCFFVLKGAAVAHNGQAFAEPPGAEAGIAAQIHHWFAGADPISATLATALRNAPRPGARDTL